MPEPETPLNSTGYTMIGLTASTPVSGECTGWKQSILGCCQLLLALLWARIFLIILPLTPACMQHDPILNMTNRAVFFKTRATFGPELQSQGTVDICVKSFLLHTR